MSLIPDERICGSWSPGPWPGFPVASRSQPPVVGAAVSRGQGAPWSPSQTLSSACQPHLFSSCSAPHPHSHPPAACGDLLPHFLHPLGLLCFPKPYLALLGPQRMFHTAGQSTPWGITSLDPLLSPILLFQKLVWSL